MDHSHSTGQSMALPRTRYRLSKDISFDNALGLRNHNAQSVPLLPPDHPHAKSHGTENMAPSSTERPRTSRREEIDDGIKEHKRSKSTVSLRSLVGGGDSKKPKDKASRTKDRSSDKKSQSPKKTMKKSKSSTGLASLFGVRNKSSKDLTALAADTQGPIASPSQDTPLQTPIWAQFATQQPDHIESHSPTTQPRVRADVSDERILNVKNEIDRYTPKEYDPTRQRDFVGIKPALSRPTSSHRPQSTIISGTASRVDDLQRALLATQRAQLGSRGSDSSTGAGRIDRSAPSSRPQSMHWDLHRHNSGPSTEQVPAHDIAVTKRGSRVAAAVAAINNKVASPRKAEPPKLDPQQVEQAFEAVLERRNIPEDQRRSMRSLTLHVKADFVRQDEKTSRPSSPVKADIPNPFDQQAKAQDEATEARSPTKRERNRSRSRTRAFQFSKSDSSPSKKQRSASRPRSMQDASQLTRTDTNNSQTSERGRSSSVGRSAARVALPEDYVGYLRAMKDPRQAEVGRVHKLRILLRNETVTWVDAFVSLGGMSEIIALLYRIMEIEWREDHEDQLLHETLLCLKGISTTHLALQKLAEVADELFPKLLGMIFDEEKKGPSEFTTRGVIVAVLFAHLSSASGSGRDALAHRATQILTYLADSTKSSASQTLPFVAEMHTRRPYRIWTREVTNVTKEVFWIFLHHGNTVAPVSSTVGGDFPRAASTALLSDSYRSRHFPGPRPPVPAAPYVGGVEWDATLYLAAHLDLANGIIASLPDSRARNALREDMRSSGWEKVMGGSLRTCKEKFYAGVHDGLRTWVAAAIEDGWDVEFVRTGKGGEEQEIVSPVKKKKLSKEEREKVVLPTLGLGEVKFEKKTDLDGWLV